VTAQGDTTRARQAEDAGEVDFYTVGEIAAIMRADPRTIRARIKSGDIPATFIGEYRIPARWMRERLNAGTAA
jgi:excisionase family DNA binding protein